MKTVDSDPAARSQCKTSAPAAPVPSSRVTPERFRDALAALPAGVVVLTSLGCTGEFAGATVSAFMSLSMDPPLVLLSLKSGTRTADAIRSCNGFAAHIVGERHRELALEFAGGGARKFDAVEYTLSETGIPILGDFDTVLRCSLYAEHPGGDHVIFIGQVEEIVMREGGSPAVWFDRRFHVLPPASV